MRQVGKKTRQGKRSERGRSNKRSRQAREAKPPRKARSAVLGSANSSGYGERSWAPGRGVPAYRGELRPLLWFVFCLMTIPLEGNGCGMFHLSHLFHSHNGHRPN